MGRRAILIASVLALASAMPGCITAIATAAGADARTIESTLEADKALLNVLAGEPTDTTTLAYDEEAAEPPVRYGEADAWRCMLDTGEEQLVRAYSLEGARAACLMANDVDLVADGCACFPAP